MKHNRTKTNYRKIAEDYYGISVKGMHVHHIDGDCHNNNPENLVICTAKQHADFHREMGQEHIALLLEGQNEDNWFSVIGKIGAEKSKNVPRSKYTMTQEALTQRINARKCKGDQINTKLSLKGEDRTDMQKIGKIKASKTRKDRGLTEKEINQLNDFRKLGQEAAKLALTGSKKFIHPINNTVKFAKPNSEKWFNLLNDGYVIN